MSRELTGYHGYVLRILEKSSAVIGDVVRVESNSQVFEGILMPRYEFTDDEHVVLKLKSGYNVGIHVTPTIQIRRIGRGTKPSFTLSPQPQEKSGLPEVAIISTGGTIASRVDYRTGAVHAALTARDLHNVVPELSDISKVKIRVLFSLFSENILPLHWTEMANTVANQIAEGVDGVVLCHGTDTMGYTAAALSFALQNIPVPVVIVGSQRSSDRPSSDAYMNLVNAVYVAGRAPFAEVVVGMHKSTSDGATVMHRGTKVRKLHTSRRDAFKSVNTVPLAQLEAGEIEILSDNFMKRDSDKKLILKPDFDEKVALIKFYPGLNPNMLKWYVNNNYRGFVLEGTGLGHVCDTLFKNIKNAIKNGLVVGMTSQCIRGRVNMNIYDTGRDLQAMGVVPLEDMLPETALVKMMWAFGQTKDQDEVKKLLLTNMVGEISEKILYEEFL